MHTPNYCSTFHLKRASGILFLLAWGSIGLLAQQCSPDALAAKYWQYRENFNKHFILIDRDPSGCINDGIGQHEDDPCVCDKEGYSLPATSINIARNGQDGLHDRIGGTWEDHPCGEGAGGGISWTQTGVPTAKKNWLDVGSETPGQLGWYMVVLATEYELLRKNGQVEEQQKVLEEIFLALQAYRRLDIRAQCLAKKRYDEITEGFETQSCVLGNPTPCLCKSEYWDGDAGEPGNDRNHDSFAVPCSPGCNFTPQTDGYSGFFIREDATGSLEVLHDDSEGKYNIDHVGSDYNNSLAPPCTTTFSQTCYLAHRQNFMSQDQMYALMVGLAFIKRYVPDYATVTTCSGSTYNVLDIAQKIAKALTDRVDAEQFGRIAWPGSGSCCEEEVFLKENEGGFLWPFMLGLKKAAGYIDGTKHKPSFGERVVWGGTLKVLKNVRDIDEHVSIEDLKKLYGNARFYVTLASIGWDLGSNPIATSPIIPIPPLFPLSPFPGHYHNVEMKDVFYDVVNKLHKEIFQLVNNLLHPAEPNLGQIPRSYFENLLCSAPCSGPCIKQPNYEEEKAADEIPANWPEFGCSNTPNWLGQRWEGVGNDTEWKGGNRQFNGLDFMALYNMYMLNYNEPVHNYYNPNHPTKNSEFGHDRILGPGTLCLDQTAYYEAQPLYCASTANPSCIENLVWTGSDNLLIFDPNSNGTDVRSVAGAQKSFLQADFNESRNITQYFNGDATANTFEDICDFTLRKPITTITPVYSIAINYQPCDPFMTVTADGEFVPGIEYRWRITHLQTGEVTYEYNSTQVGIFMGNYPKEGSIEITFEVSGICPGEDFTTSSTVDYTCDDNNQYLVVYPNPATDHINVGIDGYTVKSEGMNVSISRTDGTSYGLSANIQTYGQFIDISSLPEGSYILQASAADLPATTSTFIISRQ